ncbi:hypothetical protein B0T26DRAFT_705927 [Lasiosphaeria miniovina]|uniref:NmrA-like domain-containing protein n=1 Tax=Lasiosphaeria miniovina TaxID=1954250 RepID=A0AA40E176_9PEZI|nr:uncharacterized protein B0T26DRAFT_705927 [Lasiosphaeria miniovina]KAK0723260.1 hypothetical protein B0T26DRAFT_705927 [Lasiosphaeria miniovina]
MATPSILVVGAGELGTAVATALAKHPHRRRGKIGVLRRAETQRSADSAKQAETARLSALGAVHETGDFVSSSVAELADVFRRYDVVVQCGGFGLPAGTQLRVTEAALRAGVPRFFPWQFGVDYPTIGLGSAHELFDEMLEVRTRLRGQTATQWTIVSTGLFMSFLFVPSFGVVQLDKRVVRALGSWENRVTVTTPEDIGTMVAEAAYVPGDTVNSVVFVAGETISYGRLADLLDSVSEAKFDRKLWDIGYLSSELQSEPNDLMLKYRNIFGAGVGVAWDVDKTLNHQRGIAMTSLEEYVRENRDPKSRRSRVDP